MQSIRVAPWFEEQPGVEKPAVEPAAAAITVVP